MRTLVIALTAVIGVWLAAPAFAQDQPMPPEAKQALEMIEQDAPPPESSAPAAQDESDYGAFRIQQEITHRTLLIVVIVAAIVSLVIVLGFLKLLGNPDPVTMVNASGLVLVIFGTIVVVMIARVDQQLTAAMGILGAVAGYLFGTSTRPRGGAPADSGDKSPDTRG